jgi:protein-disulfide reductase (glutathione)
MSALLLRLLSLISDSLCADATGWPAAVAWKTMEEGKALSKETGKPLMLLVHKSWCGACKRLKSSLAEHSGDFVAASKSFVMVNAGDDNEPAGDAYTPDGGYIPRVLFFDPDHQLIEAGKSGNPKYAHFFPTEEALVGVMTKVATASQGAKSEL